MRRAQAKNKTKILDKNDPLKTCLSKQMTGTVKTNDKREDRWQAPKDLTGIVRLKKLTKANPMIKPSERQ